MKGVAAVMLVVIVAMAQLMVKPSEAIDCGTVVSSLTSCVPYISGQSQDVSSCCQGVKNLMSQAPAKEDRQAVCECAKAAAANFPNLKPDAAASIPQKCGVSMNVPISRNVDCKSVS